MNRKGSNFASNAIRTKRLVSNKTESVTLKPSPSLFRDCGGFVFAHMFTFSLALACELARYSGIAAKLRLIAVKLALYGFNRKAAGALFTIRWSHSSGTYLKAIQRSILGRLGAMGFGYGAKDSGKTARNGH